MGKTYPNLILAREAKARKREARLAAEAVPVGAALVTTSIAPGVPATEQVIPLYASVHEVSLLLRIPEPKIKDLLASGAIPCARFGDALRVPLVWVHQSVATARREAEESKPRD